MRLGERSLTCWQRTAPSPEPIFIGCSAFRAYEHEFDCSYLSCSSLSAMTIGASRFAPDPPSCLPLLHARYAFLSSYGGSVIRLPFTCPAAGIPDSPHLNLPVVLSPITPCLPMSAFTMLVSFRVLGSFPQGRFPSAPIGFFSRLRHSVAGSPRHKAESSFLSYGPTGSPSVALHPALRRRSYGWLSTSRAFG